MSWTFSQFNDVISEVEVLGELTDFDGYLVREVTLKTGERFLIDATLVFPTREAAERVAGVSTADAGGA